MIGLQIRKHTLNGGINPPLGIFYFTNLKKCARITEHRVYVRIALARCTQFANQNRQSK